MSNIDFQNGVIVGMATKGLIKTGKSYKPYSVTNSDLVSITIDFGVSIPDISLSDIIEALYVTANYGDSQILIPIQDVEKLSSSVVKLFVPNYFSTNGILSISYDASRGGLKGYITDFIYTFFPDGVPTILYKKENLNSISIGNIINIASLYMSVISFNSIDLIDPIEGVSSDNISSLYVSDISDIASLVTSIVDSVNVT